MLPIIEPIVPTLRKSVPVGSEWRYEPKLDGFRGTLYIEAGNAFFRSKTKRHMKRFDSLAASLLETTPVRDAIFDGEIITLVNERIDFTSLMRAAVVPKYAAFDLLWLSGRDLRALLYLNRKAALKRLLKAGSAIGYVEEFRDPKLFEATVASDLEGIVAKRKTDPYDPSAVWIKVKNNGYSQNEGRWELFRR